jgi:[acyl-carrier-protein] S-malonyltransferase
MIQPATAFVFPGQGSQRVGMLGAAYQQYRSVRDTFDEAAEALGYDVWRLVSEGEQDALNLTETTQPVLLTTSVALWRAWLEAGGAAPRVMSGHSLGEFSALVCAGAMRFRDAVRLVRLRGRFMQSAVPVGEGAMMAIIGLDDERIDAICRSISSPEALVSAVNYNCPGQVVIAGHAAAVTAAAAALREAGAKRAMPLAVSAPFHTDLMRPAGEQLAAAMTDIPIASPEIPVVHNVHAQSESDPERIRELMVEQIYSPVQWHQCIETIAALGVSFVIECGPGKVLSKLMRRIDTHMLGHALEEPDALRATLTELAA